MTEGPDDKARRAMFTNLVQITIVCDMGGFPLRGIVVDECDRERVEAFAPSLPDGVEVVYREAAPA